MNGVALIYPCRAPSRDPMVVLKLLGSLRSLEANAVGDSLGRLVVATSEPERFRDVLQGDALVVEVPDLAEELRRTGVADANKNWAIMKDAFAGLDAAFPHSDDGHALLFGDDVLLAHGPYDLRTHPLLHRCGTLTMAQHAARTDKSSGGAKWKRSLAATARLLEGSPGFDGRMYSVHAPVWAGVREARWIREKVMWGASFHAHPEGYEPWSMFAAAAFALGTARPVAEFDNRKPATVARLAAGIAESGPGREFISYDEAAELPLAALAMLPRPSRWERPGAVVGELLACLDRKRNERSMG